MEVVRFVALAIAGLSPLAAAEFTLTIANPIAANIARMKSAGIAVRLENCADLSKATLTGTGEGTAAGVRKSVSLQVTPGAIPGVYAVGLTAPLEGAWVASLKATCGKELSGAIVPFRGPAFVRDAVKVLPRFATEREIHNALNETTGGPK
ncbi:MAG TPA: hypothetical protein VGF16_15160 [Bryobacteraceae bacterium]|jgi:hypothetical protein